MSALRPMESEWRFRYMTYDIIRHPKGHWVVSKAGRFAGIAGSEREAKAVVDRVRKQHV